MVDHAIHLYHGALGARFLPEHGTTWGYDPFFMAGYPETPVWDSSSNLSIAFQLAAGGRYSPRAYKLGLFACTFLVVAFAAGRGARGGPGAARGGGGGGARAGRLLGGVPGRALEVGPVRVRHGVVGAGAGAGLVAAVRPAAEPGPLGGAGGGGRGAACSRT